MLKHKHIDKICILLAVAACALAAVFLMGDKIGIRPLSSIPEYSVRLFDAGYVHRIDLRVENWEEFLRTAPEEQYTECDAEIDGEVFSSIGLRAKGNNSRRLVEEYGLKRYSLKIEFDHYQEGNTYYGLDKMSLDASFQDNSYLKNYIAYDMMNFMEVPAPLCSYVWVTVNGENWGLFLAVEEPEEAFAKRNFGADYGRLYKPDYRSLEAPNNDVALKYTTENPEDYDNIFRNAKFDCTEADQRRLIQSLKILSETEGEQLKSAINVDEVLRYFTVQVFVVNLDSYLGHTGHNYFLYEENGLLSILPWDYNLAYATYSLGMPKPVNDAELYVNYPIDTPAPGEIMLNRPLYHNLMQTDEYFSQYHTYFDILISEYFESGYFAEKAAETAEMIAPYVEKDPTAFCTYEEHLIGVETFMKFCLLRAESVRGQLDGTIPSTIAGQEEDRISRVDASEVWLPDMGEISDLSENTGQNK